MTLRCWGVRGSIPVPGPSTVRYGGNTTCISLDLGEDLRLILDAGTGIRVLGETQRRQVPPLILLLTHLHLDHIHGLPFFRPLYDPGQFITIALPHADWLDGLARVMDGERYFPMPFDGLPSSIDVRAGPLEDFFEALGIGLRMIRTNHPGLCYGYRLVVDGCVVVFMPDNELFAEPAHTSFDEFVTFCQDADVLFHDSQYTEEDFPDKRGWGHSTAQDVCRLAEAARVKRLYLIHHDPARDDASVAELEARAQALLGASNGPTRCMAAREGQTILLAPNLTHP